MEGIHPWCWRDWSRGCALSDQKPGFSGGNTVHCSCHAGIDHSTRGDGSQAGRIFETAPRGVGPIPVQPFMRQNHSRHCRLSGHGAGWILPLEVVEDVVH